ncbi:MAG: putative nucleotidyltransferase [uncultured archaeon A07HN63]|nr:MAG: putative nucleotidyltransferase [uncultured archaeon A07HN63]
MDCGIDDDALDAVRWVLADYPVRLGVLFGSHASGTAGSHSDVDIAVEFDPDVVDDERYRHRLSLLVDLSQALGTDDLDLVDLDTVRPAVGLSALQDATLLVGDQDRRDQLVSEFERRAETPTADQRRDRFDAALERLEERV